MADYTWSDWIELQKVDVDLVRVRSRSELVTELTNYGNWKNKRLKVLSSGHSTSDVAQPVKDHLCLELRREKWIPDVDDPQWYPPTVGVGGFPVWVPACKTLSELNDVLDARHLAFENLGSYDQQSVYGAICTGTHGSGMVSGPLADFVLSLDLTCVVKDDAGEPVARSFRLEPEVGKVTDRALFEAANPDVELIQEDAPFKAAVVSLGLFGVVTGLVLRAVKEFWLEETRDALTWEALKLEVDAKTFDPATERRCDLALTSLPVANRGDRRWVLRTRRTELETRKDKVLERNDARTRTARASWKLYGKNRMKAARGLAHFASRGPELANNVAWERMEEDVGKPFISRSDKVLFSSVGEYACATSTEVAVPLHRWVAATDAIAAALDQLHAEGFHLLSPVGIRFSRGSEQLLAQQTGRPTCTFELPTLVGAHGKPHDHNAATSEADIAYVLSTLEKVLVDGFEGRPHWGQRSWTDAALLPGMYGANWAEWKKHRARFDPFGVFSNAFSQRLGL